MTDEMANISRKEYDAMMRVLDKLEKLEDVTAEEVAKKVCDGLTCNDGFLDAVAARVARQDVFVDLPGTGQRVKVLYNMSGGDDMVAALEEVGEDDNQN